MRSLLGRVDCQECRLRSIYLSIENPSTEDGSRLCCSIALTLAKALKIRSLVIACLKNSRLNYSTTSSLSLASDSIMSSHEYDADIVDTSSGEGFVEDPSHSLTPFTIRRLSMVLSLVVSFTSHTYCLRFVSPDCSVPLCVIIVTTISIVSCGWK